MKYLYQPKVTLLIISLLIIAYCLLNHDSAVNIYLYDTFFVINNLTIAMYLGGFFLLQSFIYQLTDNYKQWRSIQHIHVISVLLIILGSFFFKNYQPYWDSYYQAPYAMIAVVLFFALGQILFIVNVVAGFVRGKKVLNHTP